MRNINSYLNISYIIKLIGEKEEALETLEKSFKLGYNNFNFILNTPHLESLRKEPSFRKLIEQYQK